VTTSSGEVLECRRIAIATGNNQVPRYPAWRDELTAVDVVHSHDYRNPSALVGKRVLLVGGGESGADLALEIARVAERCWVSLRGDTGWVVPRRRGEVAADSATHRGFWGLPRELGPWVTRRFIERERERRQPVFDVVAQLNERVRARYGVFGTFGTKTVALAQAVATHGCSIVGGVARVRDGGRTIETFDGQTIADVDAVVLCTGFSVYAPFEPRERWARQPRSLYKQVFDPELGDRAARIGMARPAFGSQFPIMELQARWFAAVASGRALLPPRRDMERDAAHDATATQRQFESAAERIATLVDYHNYMDDLARILGCSPPLRRLLMREPALWLRVVYGPTQGTQFRLRGPGSKPALAREILGKLPITPLNHVFEAGVYGRALAAWNRVRRPWTRTLRVCRMGRAGSRPRLRPRPGTRDRTSG
jgi:dimethylaniline monooxygenase (N-oxide forming)